MARRKSQRKVTKKDYRKIACVDEDLSGDGEQPCFSGNTKNVRDGDQNNNNNNTISDDEGSHTDNGEILNREILADEEIQKDSDGVSSPDASDDDDAIKEAKSKLEEIRNEHRRLSTKTKKSKLDRINQEVEEAKKSLDKLKRKRRDGNEKRKKATATSLRDMEDVMVGVDKLMDRNLNLGRKKVELSDSSESNSSSSDQSSTSSDSSSTDFDSDVDERRKKKKDHRRKKGKGKGKKKSGKSKRLTSYVKYPQKWPHSALSLHFVNREKKYEELSLAEFCAGYATILETSSERTRAYRTAHLKEIMYLATKYQWKCVLNYHAAVLLEIERGHLRWGDSFQILQNTTLAGGFLHPNRSGSNNSSSNRSMGGSTASSGSGPSNGRDEGTLFCRAYQRGTCKQARDHYGWFNNENRLLKHICAKCWLNSRTLASHPETDDSCPHKDDP